MQIPCVYLPGPAPAVTVANTSNGVLSARKKDESFSYGWLNKQTALLFLTCEPSGTFRTGQEKVDG